MFKNTWKKVAAVALGAAMVSALVVAGCAKSDEPAATDTNTNQEPVVEALPYEGVELQIFAANSLSAAMPEVQALFTEKTGCTFADTQFLSSGDLNAQLEGGAYADVLISASKGKMDAAEEGGLINADTRVNMFVNDLVIVTAEGNNDITEVTLEDVASGDYTVAVGDSSVPAGNYANQSLSTVGLWAEADGKVGSEAKGTDGEYTGALAGDGMVLLASKVGDVCSYAQTGDADLAFVYSSDVYRFGGVKVVCVVPADTHKNIVYPAALTSQCANTEAAQAFVDFCMTDPDALAIWQSYGFELA